MFNIKKYCSLAILIIQMAWIAPGLGQEITTDSEIEKRAKQAFEKKDFETPLTYVDPLLEKYPRDPQLNYYSGVSLVQIGRLFNTAIYQLKLASLGDSPPDVYFF